MSITITYAWWWIPTIITIVGLIWAILIVDGGGGIMSGLANLLALVPVLFVATIAWIIAGVLK